MEDGWWQRWFGKERAPVDVKLPVDKLALPAKPSGGGTAPKPVVLVSCGSFNPPTVMHLRMFELAAHGLEKAGYAVLGGYLSPVNAGYQKAGLARVEDRLRMCELAAKDSALVMVDAWEATQLGYQRTLPVLQHFTAALANAVAQAAAAQEGQQNEALARVAEQAAAGGCWQEGPVRSMLLCGADLLATLAMPGIWKPEDVRAILLQHGIVCITRETTDVAALVDAPGTVLHELRDSILIVQDPITNDVSSTKLRQQVHAGGPINYLTPDPVIDFIHANKLYK